MSENIIHVTDQNFESEVLESNTPVLVDFWATWCGPCRMLSPILDDISGDYAGKVKITKLNIDENPNTPTQYGVRGIPTIILFKGGETIGTQVGALTKSQLIEFIDNHIS